LFWQFGEVVKSEVHVDAILFIIGPTNAKQFNSNNITVTASFMIFAAVTFHNVC